MKKSIKVYGLALGLGFLALTSCKKNECHECHYEKDGAEVELGERCGDDLKNLEKNGYNVDGTTYEVHCHEH